MAEKRYTRDDMAQDTLVPAPGAIGFFQEGRPTTSADLAEDTRTPADDEAALAFYDARWNAFHASDPETRRKATEFLQQASISGQVEIEGDK